jgi:pyruvate dehydrogenase E2 component (dihydrolipoamide acetyltransferase)
VLVGTPAPAAGGPASPYVALRTSHFFEEELMPTKVYMEALSPTMEEGRLVTWLKNEGDAVAEGDVLAEVETDKATMELVARGAGVLRKRTLEEGGTAAVGTVIAVIAGEDEDVSGLTGGDEGGGDQAAATAEAPAEMPEGGDEGAEDDAAEGAKVDAAPDGTAPDKAERGTPEEPTAGAKSTPRPAGDAAETEEGEPQGDGRVKASPLARRLAAESGVALDGIRGSGPGGRVVKRDIEEAAKTGPAAKPAAVGGAPAAAPAPAATADTRHRDVPLSQMRKTIARRLTQSIGPVPHFFLTVEVDMREAMRLRGRINERLKEEGIKVSPNDLIIKATAMALRKHPYVNAAWTGDAIRLYEQVHVGVAVAVEDGLITPVVRDAQDKGIGEIAAEVKEMAGRAREKKLKPEEYTGSTFSISNLGMFGIEEFTAVINPPEAAILAVGAIGDKVVAEDGEMVIRPRMRMTLSCDHRVVDGATGAEFLRTLVSYLEEPMLMMA